MILVTYDISNDKLRTKFSKFLEKFGNRLQYSVFQIKNSNRILKNIMIEIKSKFEKKFTESDSVLIIETSKTCKLTRFGFLKHDEDDIIIV